MAFLDLHVIFFITSTLLLIIEVIMGMALGFALAGSITFFFLGLIEWLGFIKGLNNYLILGSVIFIGSVILILKYFKNSTQKAQSRKDVNDY